MYVGDLDFGGVRVNGRHVARGDWGLADGSSPTDKILQSVLMRYNVADSSQLPAAVLAKYRDAQVYLRDQATQIAGGDNALGGALASVATGVAGSILSGDPKAVFNAAWNGTLAVMAMSGGPIGAAVAGGLAAVMALIQALPHAHGGGGAVGDACSQACDDENWYGGFILGKDMPPTDRSDPRWIHWDNTVPKKLASQSLGYACSDDVPISGAYQSCRNWMTNVSVSGQFTWLRSVLAFYPADGFDHALASQVANALELYLNAQGPMPTTMYGVQGTINLRDMAEGFLRGWNATHEPGNVVTINFADNNETIEGFHNETYQQVTDTALKTKHPWPGALMGYFIGMDPRDKSALPKLHTGPPVKELRDLFAPPGGLVKSSGGGGGSSGTKKVVVGTVLAGGAATGGLYWYAHKHGLSMMQAFKRVFGY